MEFVHRYHYPERTVPERWADGAVHAIGIAGAAWATLWIIIARPDLHTLPFALYLAIINAALLISAAYHLTPNEDWREPLRRMDHAAIFLKIAATYTPLVFAVGQGFTILATVWALALACAIGKMHFGPWPEWISQGAYLGLAWCAGALLWSIMDVGHAPVLASVVSGGLILSGGLYFLNRTDLTYSMALWHGCVVVATLLFFLGLLGIAGHN